MNWREHLTHVQLTSRCLVGCIFFRLCNFEATSNSHSKRIKGMQKTSKTSFNPAVAWLKIRSLTTKFFQFFQPDLGQYLISLLSYLIP